MHLKPNIRTLLWVCVGLQVSEERGEMAIDLPSLRK